MDPVPGFTQRLRSAMPFLWAWFAAGFGLAWWNPHPRLILTVAFGIALGMLLLGPYAAAALYTTRLQRFWRGHLRWPLCLALGLSTTLLLDYALDWPLPQLVLAAATATLGTILGHDAALAVLELRGAPETRVDCWMVMFFPGFLGLAILAGYCSLGFGMGSYYFVSALLR
jgi:hypothetical protein